MDEKVLKSNGTIKIEGEEILTEDLDIECKPNPMPKKVLEKAKEEFNNMPVNKANKVIVVGKIEHLFWKILSIVLIAVIFGAVVWYNISFMNKDFAPKINNTVNVEPADVLVPVSVNNSYTINNNNQNNVTVILDKSLLQGILNALNNTN